MVRTRSGRETSRTYVQMKAGCIWQWSLTCGHVPLLASSLSYCPPSGYLLLLTNHVLKSLHRQRSGFVTSVHHRMTVWAQRDKFRDRIDPVAFPQSSQRPDMMDMNKSFSAFTIGFLKIKATTLTVTNGAIVIHTQRLKSDPGGNLLS